MSRLMQGQRQIKGACAGVGFQNVLQKEEVAPCWCARWRGSSTSAESQTPKLQQRCSCNHLANYMNMLQELPV